MVLTAITNKVLGDLREINQIDKYDRTAGLDIQGESRGLVDIQIPYILKLPIANLKVYYRV
jgi:hypothetical protein